MKKIARIKANIYSFRTQLVHALNELGYGTKIVIEKKEEGDPPFIVEEFWVVVYEPGKDGEIEIIDDAEVVNPVQKFHDKLYDCIHKNILNIRTQINKRELVNIDAALSVLENAIWTDQCVVLKYKR